MRKVVVVARRELTSTLRRRSYLIVTFGMPFFTAAYFGLFALLPAYFMARSAAAMKEVAVVDEAGVIVWDEARAADGAAGDGDLERASGVLERLPRGPAAGATRELLQRATARVRFRPAPSRNAALADLRQGAVERVYVVTAGYLATGAVETYQNEQVKFTGEKTRADRALHDLLSRSLLSGRLEEAVRARVERPIDAAASRSFTVREDGTIAPFDATARLARMAIPAVFALLLLMSLMTSAGYLLQGVAEEKENRVIEIILSSVRPHQLLLGKLLGLGAAGLLQLAVWVTVASLATSLVAAAALAALDARLFVSCLVFFVLGFLMIGSLMTGTGALGTNARESQQLAAVWSLVSIVPPAVAWLSILDSPNGWTARILGWFPPTAPITMMMRLASARIPAWDIAVAVLSLILGIYAALRVAAALFRLGLLLHGKRPSFAEVVRQIRHA